MSNPSGEVLVEIKAHFRGYVSGIAKADRAQLVTCTLKRGWRDSNVYFEGRGNTPLKETSNYREYYSFGPFPEPATWKIKIENSDTGKDGSWRDSILLEPFKFHKEAEDDYPLEVYQTTIISEDGNDNDFNDCTVTVVQYRDVHV